MKDTPAFTSSFEMQLKQYIEYKQMQGYKFIVGEWNLRCFDAYVATWPAQANRFTMLGFSLIRQVEQRPVLLRFRLSKLLKRMILFRFGI